MTDAPGHSKRNRWARLRVRWRSGYLICAGLMTLGFTLLLGIGGGVVVMVLAAIGMTAGGEPMGFRPDIAANFALQALPLSFTASVIHVTAVFVSYERAFRRRIRECRCTECNYDLRGSVDAGRTECPECGCMIEKL